MSPGANLDEVHRRLVPGPNLHLLAVGVEPSKHKRKAFSYITPDSQHAMFRAYAFASVTAA
jgi:hypothetical protein